MKLVFHKDNNSDKLFSVLWIFLRGESNAPGGIVHPGQPSPSSSFNARTPSSSRARVPNPSPAARGGIPPNSDMDVDGPSASFNEDLLQALCKIVQAMDNQPNIAEVLKSIGAMHHDSLRVLNETMKRVTNLDSETASSLVASALAASTETMANQNVANQQLTEERVQAAVDERTRGMQGRINALQADVNRIQLEAQQSATAASVSSDGRINSLQTEINRLQETIAAQQTLIGETTTQRDIDLASNIVLDKLKDLEARLEITFQRLPSEIASKDNLAALEKEFQGIKTGIVAFQTQQAAAGVPLAVQQQNEKILGLFQEIQESSQQHGSFKRSRRNHDEMMISSMSSLLALPPPSFSDQGEEHNEAN